MPQHGHSPPLHLFSFSLLKICAKQLWWIGVPIRGSSSRPFPNHWNLSRVEAQYWKPKIMVTRIPISRLIQICLNTNMLPRILICVRNFFSQSTDPFPSYFWITTTGRVWCKITEFHFSNPFLLTFERARGLVAELVEWSRISHQFIANFNE